MQPNLSLHDWIAYMVPGATLFSAIWFGLAQGSSVPLEELEGAKFVFLSLFGSFLLGHLTLGLPRVVGYHWPPLWERINPRPRRLFVWRPEKQLFPPGLRDRIVHQVEYDFPDIADEEQEDPRGEVPDGQKPEGAYGAHRFNALVTSLDFWDRKGGVDFYYIRFRMFKGMAVASGLATAGLGASSVFGAIPNTLWVRGVTVVFLITTVFSFLMLMRTADAVAKAVYRTYYLSRLEEDARGRIDSP